MIFEILDLGVKSYHEVLQFQRSLHRKMIDNRKNKIPNDFGYLIMVEHPSVITLGKHADPNNVKFSTDYLKEKGIEIYSIERGGDVTFHAPGQLVVYPVFDFGTVGLGVKKYVSLLEESVRETLSIYGIDTVLLEDAPGIWIFRQGNYQKICALGLHCSHFCTMHGIALNVNTELSGFDNINPCGFKERGVTSMKEILGRNFDMSLVKECFSNIFLGLIFSL